MKGNLRYQMIKSNHTIKTGVNFLSFHTTTIKTGVNFQSLHKTTIKTGVHFLLFQKATIKLCKLEAIKRMNSIKLVHFLYSFLKGIEWLKRFFVCMN